MSNIQEIRSMWVAATPKKYDEVYGVLEARNRLSQNAIGYIQTLLVEVDRWRNLAEADHRHYEHQFSVLKKDVEKAEQERDALQNRVNGLISDWADADTALEKAGIQMADPDGRKSIEEGIDVLSKERDALRAENARLIEELKKK